MLGGDGFDVLGVAIGGPAPLGRIQLEFESGVTALYGRNGSGKTRVLTAIAEAISPTADSSSPGPVDRQVVVRVHGDRLVMEGPLDGWTRAARAALAGALSEQAQARLQSDSANEAARHLEDPPQSIEELACAIADMKLWHDNPQLIARVGADGMLVVRPQGDQLTCGPAMLFNSLADADADLLLWDSISWIDHFVGAQLGLLEFGDMPSPAPVFDIPSLWVDRLLDPRAIADIERGEIASRSYRDDWYPYALGTFGTLAEAPCRLAGWSTDPRTLRARSLQALRSAADSRLVEAVLEEDVVLSDAGNAALESLVRRASAFLALTLLDAPPIRLRLGTPDEWLGGSAPAWEALDVTSGSWLTLEALSTAQHRWATLAVELALAEATDPGRPIVVLVDEPEAALHRTAERHLVAGLKRLALELNGAAVIVATHSPAFLADPGVRAVHIHRARSGLAIASEIDLPIHDDADRELALSRLGLGTADVLQLARVVVAVEGAHDKAVLEVVAAEDVGASRALITRMHGAKNAIAVFDAQLVLAMTDATVLVVMDNLVMKDLGPRWSRLHDRASVGDFSSARTEIGGLRRIGSAEAEWLADLADRALRLGRIDRVEVFGLSEPDVIFYLDPAHFSLDASWTDLHREWRSRSDRTVDFKSWLRSEKGASISTQRVRKAAKHLSDLPSDLGSLSARIREVSLRPTAI